MIDISVPIDEGDLNTLVRVYCAAQKKLDANGVALDPEAHKRIILGRIFKNGLAQEEQRFLRDPVADARKVQTLFRGAPERMA
jgi:hypothetical protein